MLEVAGQLVEIAPAVKLIARIVALRGRADAHAIVDEVFDALPAVDAAALAHDWEFWARPKQRPTGSWLTWGNLTGRGFGKTYGISKFINEEVEAGRARMIGLMAQDEANSIALQVLGPSGLIATAPPWFRPTWEATPMQLVWPNGARAVVRTPEVPGKIRGFDYDFAWLSEIQSFPTATGAEAISNMRLATRIGLQRTVWDATPKRRHPLLRELIAEHEADPDRHILIRGTTHENAINLADGYIDELEKKYGGTLKGREELYGEMLAESETALFRQSWIDRARRNPPDGTRRRLISVDPAITARKGSDRTGIVEAGLAADGQALVLGDFSDKHSPPAWAKIVLDRYGDNRLDLVLVETNRGGDLVTQNLRAAAESRGLRVVVVGKEEQPRHTPGVVHVKEIHSRGEKQDRAQPVATAYERGRVSHVRGVDLSSLEDTLTTWEPSPTSKSPDDLDALVAAVVELLGLNDNEPDPRAGFVGFAAAANRLRTGGPSASILDHLKSTRKL